MAYVYETYCRCFGERFSPRKLMEDSGAIFESVIEPGDYDARRDSYYSYGCASSKTFADFRDVIDFLRCWSEKLLDAGAQDLIVHVDYFYEAQCNVEIPIELLRAIVENNAEFTFSCYESGDEESE